MRILLPSLILMAACTEGTGLQCPPNTTVVGQYSLAYTAVHDAGECQADAGDGGVTNLTLSNLAPKASMLCVGTGSDGGPQPQLLVQGKSGANLLALREDGGFHLSNTPLDAQQTACVCQISIVESLDGFLQTSGPFALRPDGGLPPITGITATLSDQITSQAAGCLCTFPCTVTYTIAGTPF